MMYFKGNTLAEIKATEIVERLKTYPKPKPPKPIKIRKNWKKSTLTYEGFCKKVDDGVVGEKIDHYVDTYPDHVRRKIEEDIIFLARDILGYAWDAIKKGEGFCNPPNELHVEMVKLFEEALERFVLGLFPRGSYKSTLIAIAKPIQILCKNPEETIAICGETGESARDRLLVIRNHLKYNDNLLKLYGRFMPRNINAGDKRWNRFKIDIEQRKHMGPNASITTASVVKKITGIHPGWLILDDVVSKDNVKTFDQIQMVINFINACIDLAGTSGKIIILGTPYKFDDMYAYVKSEWLDKIDEVTGLNMFAFKQMAVWDENEENPPMPSKYSIPAIRTLKNIKPRNEFATQYLCNPSAAGNTLIKKGDIEQTQYFAFPYDRPEKWWAYMAIDPGASLQAKKCYTGIDVGIPIKPYDLYIDEAVKIRAEPSVILETIMEIVLRPHYMGHFRLIVVESNSFQRIYEGSLINDIREKAHHLSVAGNKEAAKALSLIQVIGIPADDNKDFRIYALEPYFRHHQIHIKTGLKDLLFQVENYPNISDNNRDLLDALTYFPRPEVLGLEFLVNPYGIIKSQKTEVPKRKLLYPRKVGDEDRLMERSYGRCF